MHRSHQQQRIAWDRVELELYKPLWNTLSMQCYIPGHAYSSPPGRQQQQQQQHRTCLNNLRRADQRVSPCYTGGTFVVPYTQHRVHKRVRPVVTMSSTTPSVSDSGLDISELLALFRKNVQVKDRKYRLGTYRKCFVGSEAVQWLVTSGTAQNRQDALRLGQLLQDAGFIEHCLREHEYVSLLHLCCLFVRCTYVFCEPLTSMQVCFSNVFFFGLRVQI